MTQKTKGSTTRPGTKDDKGKKEKKAKKSKRAPHPSVIKLGKGQKLEAVPPDFDYDRHLPLKKKQLKDEPTYLDYRADEAEYRAAAFRAKAEESRKLGTSKDRSKAKRLKKMQEKMAELIAQLKEQGVDTDALLATEE